ncbi:DUF4357 domain-containing protein [Bacillus sp. AFS096315]|uniref:DUF4357 domain-containing protein n=1 Tax=Bacillus sp. AFS096315 TaxID=2033517 RepID=UPI0015965E09|nr:DUF4357 domain-containing protein [Bacillus sp. AFS096315]
MAKDNANSFPKYLIPVRENLMKDGIVILKGSEFVFVEDYLFDSPSASSSLITGMFTNGWDFWENIESKSLKDVRRKEL